MIAAVDGMPDVTFRTEESELESLRADIVDFLRETVADAGADGVIVCLSGGIDSTLTAHLCVEALGPERVTALVLPCHLTDAVDTLDAHSIAQNLGVDPTMVQLQPLLDMFEDSVAPAIEEEVDRVALGNAIARLRMSVAYYAANMTGRLVCGTSNRTELLLGYFTKHGDGAADLRPLADLYKTEVKALARHVGVPRTIIQKPPTAGLWDGQTDEEELGAPYGLLDVLLYGLVDENLGVEGTADELGIDPGIVREYAELYLDTAHKRQRASKPETDRTDSEGLFCELEGRL
ncbi:NAD+ synthase [Natronomonas gomsonensis]|jgi:NAD+ synthase|uniref:NAD+ synthase n=1 Tax=Natronomonas gomsonensis TaxID=1046043 RepID=UPI0020CA7F75|nr:NAD+ synthase [Natronomonas gomsonensis]MCY4731965.1 NAD+ synthase [Natronomonas gomsonensis]